MKVSSLLSLPSSYTNHTRILSNLSLDLALDLWDQQLSEHLPTDVNSSNNTLYCCYCFLYRWCITYKNVLSLSFTFNSMTISSAFSCLNAKMSWLWCREELNLSDFVELARKFNWSKMDGQSYLYVCLWAGKKLTRMVKSHYLPHNYILLGPSLLTGYIFLSSDYMKLSGILKWWFNYTFTM